MSWITLPDERTIRGLWGWSVVAYCKRRFGRLPGFMRMFLKYERVMPTMIATGQVLHRGQGKLRTREVHILMLHCSVLLQSRAYISAYRRFVREEGLEEATINAICTNWRSASLPAGLHALFAFAEKLTLQPGAMTAADWQAVRAAGWSEAEALHALHVICLYNYVARVANGMGIEPDQEP